jgi:hypothetical protein
MWWRTCTNYRFWHTRCTIYPALCNSSWSHTLNCSIKWRMIFPISSILWNHLHFIIFLQIKYMQ